MKYQSILEEVKSYDALKSIHIDRNRIMNSLGIDLENSQFIDLSNVHTEELNDIIMKSLTWMERLNEILATAKKIHLDLGLEADKVFNQEIRKSTAGKATDAKASAKTSDDYIRHQKKVNLLDAYVDYLERLIKNIEKIHYAVKGRLDAVRGVELKHYAH
jgi:predicted metal-dependent hydrolase